MGAPVLFIFINNRGAMMIKRMSLAVATMLFLNYGGGAPLGDAQTIKHYNEPPFEFYKVSPGDSFWYIGKRYGLDYRELMRLNPNVDPLNMQIGSTIRLKAPGAPGTIGEAPGDFEARVVDLVNQERAKAGLEPLKYRADVAKVAEEKSRDMVIRGYFSHRSPRYGSPFDMLKQFGISYRTAGENIAQGQRTPEEVTRSWMNSSGHRANILNRNFDAIGVGYYEGVWTQIFIGTR